MCVCFNSTVSPMKSQIMRLQVTSDGSVFDPAVQLSILEQVGHRTSLKLCGILRFNTLLSLFISSNLLILNMHALLFILHLQIKQKLKENGMLENTKVTWKVLQNGSIFQKKKRDDL